jgi:two-component system sensor histidine kinase BaeS
VKLKLAHKIFGAFLLTSLMIVALMVGIMRFYVEQNFEEFVNKMELEKLDHIVKILSEEYEKHHSWNSLRENHQLWLEKLRLGEEKEDFNNLEGPPGPPYRQRPHDDAYVAMQNFRRNPAPPRDPLRIIFRLSLFDTQERLVAGRPSVLSSSKHTLREITLDGRNIGWLALEKRDRLSHPLAIAFIKKQTQGFFITGGGILLLAAIVSFLLSKHLLAPIRQLTVGTQALTSLKFDTRIQVHTSDELGQLANDFNLMAQTLEKYELMRKQWISDISHELRTPLSVLRGEIEAMQDGVRQVTEDSLDSLHTEALHLAKIVEDLHELSLADSGSLHLNKKPVHPLRVLKDVLRLFETRLMQSQITVHDELPEEDDFMIQGDRDRLSQLYSNLIENTLRYTDSPGTLLVWRERKGNRVTLYLEDSGPGVPQESLGRLFDRLYRVDASRTRGKGGSGLGLAICKTIAESHGAEISAANGASGGLRIEIGFPNTACA